MEAQLIAASTLLFRHLFSLSPLTPAPPLHHPRRRYLTFSLTLSLSISLSPSHASAFHLLREFCSLTYSAIPRAIMIH